MKKLLTLFLSGTLCLTIANQNVYLFAEESGPTPTPAEAENNPNDNIENTTESDASNGEEDFVVGSEVFTLEQVQELINNLPDTNDETFVLDETNVEEYIQALTEVNAAMDEYLSNGGDSSLLNTEKIDNLGAAIALYQATIGMDDEIETMTGEVSITGNTLGTGLVVSDGNTVTATFSFGGDSTITDREVTIKIPQGLRLTSASGFTVAPANGSVTAVTMTPTDLLSWTQSVNGDFAKDGQLSADGITYYYANQPSGTFTYHMLDGVSGGSITLNFQADELLYDYSGNQSLGDIVVTMTGNNGEVDPSTDQKTIPVVINPTTTAPTMSVVGETTKYVNKKVAMTLNLQETMPLGGLQNNETNLPMYQGSFKVTYPTGAVVSDVAGFTKGVEVDNGNGTSSVIITQDVSKNIVSGVINNYWVGGVTYPIGTFNAGDTVTATISDVVWKSLTVDDQGVASTADHIVAGSSDVVTTLTVEPDFDPYYKNNKADWEAYNDGQTELVLTESYNANRGGSSYTPVRFGVECDYAKDNVSKVELFVPPLTPGNSTVTKVVYKYTDGTEVVWNSTDGTPMPGTIANNQWAQAGSNNNYLTLTAETGHYFEYAYVEVDQVIDFGYEGHNNKVYGLPVSDTPGGDYSNHKFATWQYDEATSDWVLMDETAGAGFRWKVPADFALTDYSRDGMDMKYAGNATLADVSLAKFAYVNASGTTSDDPMKWSLICDTANDSVHTVWFPIPYEINASDSANLVDSVSWTYEGDATVYSWTKDSGVPFPFTTGSVTLGDNNANISVTGKPVANYAILNAEEGKAIATLDVTYTNWSAANGGAFANVWGYPKSSDPSAPKSQHNATLSTLKSDGDIKTQLFNKTQGFKWSVLTSVQVRQMGNFNGGDNSIEGPNLDNVDIYGGSRATLKFNLVGNPLPQMTFALILPSYLTPDISSFQWRFQKANSYPEQERVIGATLKTTRTATAAELAQAGLTEGTVYIFDATNQDATTNYGTGGKRYYSYVTFDVIVDVLAPDAVLKWSQISYISTNQEGLLLNLIAAANNAVAATPIDGLGATGSRTIIGDRTRTITIHKTPRLYIEEFLKNSTGAYHAYTNNDADIVPFTPGETGTIKVTMQNTVEDADISSYDNYVFVPIGDGTSLSQQSGFDLQVNGAPTVDLGGATIDAFDYKYLTLPSTTAIAASTAATLYASGTTSYDATTNFVAIKLDRLQPGSSVVIEIPVIATSAQSNTTVYDQCSAVSVFYFSGNDRSILNAGTQTNGYLKASYRNAIWNVTFQSNGGSNVLGQSVNENSLATEPANPTRTGYSFGGWFTDDTTFNNAYNFSTPVTSDVTLYAKWEENAPVTINYVASPTKGGTLTKAVELVKPVTGNPVGSTATAKPGYTFLGWYDAADHQLSTNATYVPIKNATSNLYEAATYTAKFQANTDTAYTVEYYMEDLTGTGYTIDATATENSQGTTDTAPTVPSKTFTGFSYANTTYQDSTHTTPVDTSLNIAGDGSTVVKVYYSRKTYTVEFKDPLEGGTMTANAATKNQNVLYGGSPVGTVTVTEDNADYAWLGFRWESTDDNGVTTTGTIGTGTDYLSYVVTGNTIFTPIFAHIPFTQIVSTGNGYVKVQQGTTIPTVGTLTDDKYEWPTLNPPAYDAVHAFSAADHYKVKSITIETPNGADTTAKTITLNLGSTTDFSTITADLVETGGSAVLTMAADGRSGSIALVGVKLSDKITVTFEIIKHTFSFDTDGGTTVLNQTVNDGATATKPANPTKTGYTFDGWYEDNTFATLYDFTDTVTSDKTVYAKWVENEVTINYTSAGHGTVDNATETVGVFNGTPAGSTATADTGYHFVEWKKGSTSVGTNATFVPSKNSATPAQYEAATYQAYFAPNSYTVIFDKNATDATGTMANESFDYDETKSLTTNAFTRPGYTFGGWSTSNTGSKDYDGGESVSNLSSTDGDTIRLYAIWTANTSTAYVVEVYLRDLNSTTAYTQSTAETQNLTGATNTTASYTAPSITGFTQETAKTTYEKTGTAASTAVLDIAGDGSLVIKLYYSRNSHAVSYAYTGTTPTGAPSVPASSNHEFEDSVTVASNPTLSGYTFDGWTTTDATISSGAFDMPDQDVQITGSWTENQVTITYNTNNTHGSVDNTTETIGAATGTPTGSTATANTGYKFTEWTKNSTQVGTANQYIPTKDATSGLYETATYTANFEPIEYKVSFDANGGTGGPMANQDFTYDAAQNLTTNVYTKTGYTFAGWDTDSAGTTVVYTNGQSVNNLTTTDGTVIPLYAVWTANTTTAYRVEHYQQDLTGTGYTIVTADTQNKTGTTGGAAVVGAKTYPGFTEITASPTYESTGNTASTTVLTIAPDGSLVVKYYYDRNTHDITYTSSIPAACTTVTNPTNSTGVRYGTSETVAADLSCAGYTFSGWTPTGVTPSSGNYTMPDNDVSFNGTWTENQVTITYNTNNTHGSVDNTTETIGVVTGNPAGSTATANTGYKFTEWTKNSTQVGTADQYIPTKDATSGLYETATYTANFEPISYEVEFDKDATDATGTMANEEFDYDETKALTTNAFTRPGYTFGGWSLTSGGALAYANGASVSNLTTTDNGTVKLYALWTANTTTAYTVEVYLRDLNSTTAYTQSAAHTQNLTGTTDATASYTAPSITGFTQETGKTTYEDSATTASTTVLTIAGDGSLVIKLYYSRNTHTVTYSYTGTAPTGAPSVPAQATYEYGDTFNVDTTVPAATVPGYTFSGWNQTGTVNVEDADIAITGTWTANGSTPYTVNHFKQQDDGTYSTTPSDVENKTGQTDTTANAVPKTYTGYTLDITVTGTLQSGNIAGNGTLELALYYRQNTYTIHFNSNATDATGTTSDQNYLYDKSEQLNQNGFSRPGYYFAGWSASSSATSPTYADQEALSQLSAIDGATVDLYAVWRRITPVVLDPPTQKTITGDTPTTQDTFNFELTAISCDNPAITVLPMPDNAPGQSMQKSIVGSGSVEFGNITFTDPGVYVYEIKELPGSNPQYAYDNNVITVTYTITQGATSLDGVRTMEDADHNVVTVAEFKNQYTAPVTPSGSSGPVGRTCQDDGYPAGYYWNGNACVDGIKGYVIPGTGVN